MTARYWIVLPSSTTGAEWTGEAVLSAARDTDLRARPTTACTGVMSATAQLQVLRPGLVRFDGSHEAAQLRLAHLQRRQRLAGIGSRLSDRLAVRPELARLARYDNGSEPRSGGSMSAAAVAIRASSRLRSSTMRSPSGVISERSPSIRLISPALGSRASAGRRLGRGRLRTDRPSRYSWHPIVPAGG